MTAIVISIALVVVAAICRDVALRWIGKTQTLELGRRVAALEEARTASEDAAVKLERRVARAESDLGARVRR